MSCEIEALLLPLFRRQAKPITAADAHKMLGCKQATIAVRMTCSEMAKKGVLKASPNKGGIRGGRAEDEARNAGDPLDAAQAAEADGDTDQGAREDGAGCE